MALTLHFKYPDSLKGSGKIAEIENHKSDILLVGGLALQDLLKEWMIDLNSSRSKHNSNHYTPQGIHEPIVNGDWVSVGVYIPGITRALHDIVINPIEAKSLAIPIHSSAYGMAPKEYNINYPKGTPQALFRPKGKNYLAKNDAGNLVVMYLLRKTVLQSQDKTLLPPDEEMNSTIMEAIRDAIDVVLNS